MKWASGEEEGQGSDICRMHCPAEFEIPWLTSGRGDRSLNQMADDIAPIAQSISHANTTFGLLNQFIDILSELCSDILTRTLQTCNCEVQDVRQLEIRRSALRWNRANEDWRDDFARSDSASLAGLARVAPEEGLQEGVSVLDSRRPPTCLRNPPRPFWFNSTENCECLSQPGLGVGN
jgi:hypothetical protein